MKLVLDSSVALKAQLPEADSEKALVLLQAGHELIAPDIFPLEAAHVLSKLFRQGKITEDEARAGLVDILDSRPALKLSMRLLPAAYDISLQTRCSLWDALYVALADREKCQRVTADQKLINSLQNQFPFIVRLASLS